MRERSESASADDDPQAGGRRRWREGWIILATGLAVVLLAIVETRPPAAGHSGGTLSDAVLVGLLQINLILLVLLVFLVGRNIVKLVLDRRQRLLGSHLRTRLVVAFVAIALLPTTLLFVTAQVFMSNSIERWFDGEVERALEGSLDVANAYYQDLAADSLGFARKTANQIVGAGLVGTGRRARLKEFLAARRDDYQVDLIEVFGDGQSLARARRPDLMGRIGVEPFAEIVQQAMAGAERTAVDDVGVSDVIRAATPILVDGAVKGVVVVDAVVPKSVMKRRAAIDDSFRAYLQMKVQRRPITTNYTITLLLVTAVVLFSATWIAFYVARGITVPIQRLAEGTRLVAQGDLDERIPGEGDDEIGTLVTAFNHMTGDLKRSRTELDARRRYLEIVLANITAGVISSDATGCITTMNRAAATLLSVSAAGSIGRRLAEVFAAPAHGEIRQMVADLVHDDTAMPPYASVERHLELARDGREVAVLLTGTRLVDEAGTPQGVVLFLEDVTHLLRVERMEAWREVARRIAHEIKNPLTPIQLAAQRLRRRYAHQLPDGGDVFDDCTRTIIQQVDDLKNLVNEFSTFARMPAADHTPQDLNELLDETLVLFREAHREVDFQFTPSDVLPILELDREGVKRAVINIVDNAVAACIARSDYARGERPRIELATWHDAALGMVRVEIADNGVGMTAEVRAHIFEPYFSTKSDGTGLGMAIVSAIVADHSGFIRVRDNQPRGTRFIVEFPVRRQAAQLAARARYGAYGQA
jgi:two-component system nitrogen regulation sensor histidine kinase NtrY